MGHLLSGYSLPMEDPGQSKVKAEDIGGTWREAIKAAFDATREAFPGGEILAHLDQKYGFKIFLHFTKNSVLLFQSACLTIASAKTYVH